MVLSLDLITLGVPETDAARTFYTTALSPTADGSELDLHGTGRFALSTKEKLAEDAGTKPATSGFRGYVSPTPSASPPKSRQ